MKNISDLGKDIKKKINRLQAKSTMLKIAKQARQLIFNRTRVAGKGSDDRPLAQLSPKTIAAKKKKGRRSPSVSRLTDTKEMLDNMTADATNGEGIIFFKSAEMAQRAQYCEEAGRVFFDISKQDEAKLTIYIRDVFRSIFNTEV